MNLSDTQICLALGTVVIIILAILAWADYKPAKRNIPN